MQSRRTIYYEGNSVTPARPSKANIRRRRERERAGENKPKIVDSEPKTCATHECVWCNTTFEQYAIRCRFCGLCQYCGTLTPDANGCLTCGNILPVELKQLSQKKRRIRVT